MRARGEDEQRFGERLHRFLEDRLAQPLREVGAARLARDDGMAAGGGRHGIGDELQVRRLARTVDAFEGDELRLRFHLTGRRSW
jgi:hypothetical protein